jgi:hypothetical protein
VLSTYPLLVPVLDPCSIGENPRECAYPAIVVSK